MVVTGAGRRDRLPGQRACKWDPFQIIRRHTPPDFTPEALALDQI
jgi:hypothetical protein